jgi:hypothetical protein
VFGGGTTEDPGRTAPASITAYVGDLRAFRGATDLGMGHAMG